MEQLPDLLNKGQDVNLLAGNSGTPLNYAIKYDRLEIMKYLIDGMGADPTCGKIYPLREYGSNASHWALDGDHVSTVSEKLVFAVLDSDHESSVNEIGGLLQPLRLMHHVARGKRLGMMKLLIQYSAELDTPDPHGKILLAIAVEEDNIEIASYCWSRVQFLQTVSKIGTIQVNKSGNHHLASMP